MEGSDRLGMKSKIKILIFIIITILHNNIVYSQQKKQTNKIIPKSINFEYQLVFFEKDTYLLRAVTKNKQVSPSITKEQKIKVIVEDLLSISEDTLNQQGLRKVIKPKISVVDVKCSTQTYKTLDGVEVKHQAVMIEFSRDIIPHLNEVVLEDFVTQIRYTFELSGIECTQLDLKTKDKKGNLRNLTYFIDNKE
ncbi:MAG: hypothetical protein NZ839_00485 [Endomicrobia bacterium]|nr:hypothetical protein [Endomicrobiia bacterium]